MKLTVRCRSGLRIDFEGSLEELERFDGFLAELARLERDRLAPAPHDAIRAAVASPHVVAFEPFPDPSPPTALGLAAVLAAVREHAPAARISDVCEATGLSVKNARRIVQDLVRDGVLVAEGATVKRRYRLAGSDTAPDTQPGEQAETPVPAADPVDTVADITPVVRRQQAPHECRVIGVEARARMDAEREERNALGRERILALVAEHGPVSYSWVADQLVKNRRDTAALMRDMTLAGELAETDEGGYYDVPDRDDQAQARSLAHRSLVAATPDPPDEEATDG